MGEEEQGRVEVQAGGQASQPLPCWASWTGWPEGGVRVTAHTPIMLILSQQNLEIGDLT